MSFTAWPYPAPSTDPITSVGVAGDRFTINGTIHNIRGFTDFAGFKVFIDTGAVSPLAVQMQAIHHDFVSLSVPALTPRILLMKNGGSLFDLDPRTVPDFFGKLEACAAALHKLNILPLWVLLADCHDNGMSLDYQQAFVGQAAETLRRCPPCLVELVNEYNNGPQTVDPSQFTKPTGLIVSRGSPAEGGETPTPVWDWAACRLRRDGKWLQTIGDSAYSYRAGDWGGPNIPISCPMMDTEPRGADDGQESKRYSSSQDAFALGLLHSLWFKAAVFHSTKGLTSTPFDQPSPALNCAITFYRGCLAVPETA